MANIPNMGISEKRRVSMPIIMPVVPKPLESNTYFLLEVDFSIIIVFMFVMCWFSIELTCTRFQSFKYNSLIISVFCTKGILHLFFYIANKFLPVLFFNGRIFST